MNTTVNNYYPNYLVVHDLSKDELYGLLDNTKGIFIIPIYTKTVQNVPDFSNAPKSEYFITPFYSGGNKKIARRYVEKVLDMLYADDYLAWKPVRDYVAKQVDEKGFRETMMVKIPNNF